MDPNFARLFQNEPAHQFEPGTSSRRRAILPPEPETPDAGNSDDETDYVRQHSKFSLTPQEKELKAADQLIRLGLAVKPTNLHKTNSRPQIYEEFFQANNMSSKEELAIDKFQKSILHELQMGTFLIIRGFTGCGKSTQVPQFILNECASTKAAECNIVVTQPRRIAAISIARRVSEERKWRLGSVVGYHIGMDRQVGPNTCLTYMTTGCLLEIVGAEKKLDRFTHIIVDEVHERDQETDMLLVVLKRHYELKMKVPKVILMSATADVEIIRRHFQIGQDRVIEIANDRTYNINLYYLDWILEVLNPEKPTARLEQDLTNPTIDGEGYQVAANLIAMLDKQREIKRHGTAVDLPHLSSQRGAVLVFLPGVHEIERMHNQLNTYDEGCTEKNYWWILPLHSRISDEEQSRVFLNPRPGVRKIILATNVAESSITVPDIYYVVDFCLTKELVMEADTQFSVLKVQWASKSNCEQRYGRVGRVNNGVVYRLVNKEFYNRLPQEGCAEILRCSMESTILRTKVFEIGPPLQILSHMPQAPKLSHIKKTVKILKSVGALHLTVGGQLDEHDGDLTYLGRVMSRLPLDIRLGKLIMLGHIFDILEETIIMAAGLSSKGVFSGCEDTKLWAYHSKMTWSGCTFSDPITVLNVYQNWKLEHQDPDFRRQIDWAKRNHIQLKALFDMDWRVRDIEQRLRTLGIESAAAGGRREWRHAVNKSLLLRAVVFGAFYPNYFHRSPSRQMGEYDAAKELCGWDPFATVKLSGWPSEQPAKAYFHAIQKQLAPVLAMLSDGDWNFRIKVDSTRVFVHFFQDGNASQPRRIPGRVALPVYLALKQTKLQRKKLNNTRHFYCISFMDTNSADACARKVEELAMGIRNNRRLMDAHGSVIPCRLLIPAPRLPKLWEKTLRVQVCHVEDPHRFWVQRLDDEARQDYNQMEEMTGPVANRQAPLAQPGLLTMAPFYIDGIEPTYYRAKVLTVVGHEVRVFFIDYGNSAVVERCHLRPIPASMLYFRPLCFECRLAAVAPSLIRDPRGHWTREATDWFKNQVLDKEVDATIYSVVNGIVSVDLVVEGELGQPPQETIAAKMVDGEFAEKCEESYASTMDNQTRSTVIAPDPAKTLVLNTKESEEELNFVAELMASASTTPEASAGNDYVQALVGPSNPLEIRLSGKIKALIGLSVSIEESSVNSVLLDTTPDIKHERVVVAAMVSKKDSQRVVLRQTTLLPAIAGLPSLLTLLFAPRAELRCNADRSRLTGALCGLGGDKDLKAYDADNDMELVFDTEITVEDIKTINKIRVWINHVLAPPSLDGRMSAPTAETMREVRGKSLRLIHQLLGRRRPLAASCLQRHAHQWNVLREEHRHRQDSPENQLRAMFPLHDTIKIVPASMALVVATPAGRLS